MELKTKVALEWIYDAFFNSRLSAGEAYFKLRRIGLNVTDSIALVECMHENKSEAELDFWVDIELEEWWHWLEIPVSVVPPQFLFMSVLENLGDKKW